MKRLVKVGVFLAVIFSMPPVHAQVCDNTDPGFSAGSGWRYSSFTPGYYGSNYQYAAAGSGERTASWAFDAAAGRYEVAARWSSYFNRASNAGYTIYSNGVVVGAAAVDQRSGGGSFNLLATVDAAAGTLLVVLDNDADGYVIADAVEITAVGPVDDPPVDDPPVDDPPVDDPPVDDPPVDDPPVDDPPVDDPPVDDPPVDDPPVDVGVPVVSDDADPSFSTVGAWGKSSFTSGYYGAGYRYHAPGSGAAQAVWGFDVALGEYEVAAQWTSHANRASNAGYAVYNNGVLLETVFVDQRTGGGSFQALGSYLLAAGELTVVLTDAADGYVIADAVQVTCTSEGGNLPPDGVIVSPGGGVDIQVGESVVFEGTGTDPDANEPLSFHWDFGASGVPAVEVEDPGAVTFDLAGVYTVTFTVVDSLGLADPEPAVVRVRVVPEGVLAADVCIYGGTAAGVIAACAAADMGASVVLVSPGAHLGGMTSGGLGATDVGTGDSVTGLARRFYERLGAWYGRSIAWTHEPHAAEAVLSQMIAEREVTILFDRRLRSVKAPDGEWIAEAVFESASAPDQPAVLVSAAAFVDATYEGDLMAQAGVSYIVGRESRAQYGEFYNGVRPYWSMPGGVDPYVVPGDPDSGLVPFTGIEPGGIGPDGSADGQIQAYCFRLCMTTSAGNRRAIEMPDGYDPADFELFRRVLARRSPADLSELFLIRPLPNGKWDWNNSENPGVSLDFIGGSHAYPEADYAARAEIWQEHRYYTQGLLYFLANDPQVPVHLRTEMQDWGLCLDEFEDTDGWPHQLYVREARRMIGRYVMTEDNCALDTFVDDGIARGSYPADSHGVQRYIDEDGWVRSEGGFYYYPAGQVAPYEVSYRAITPKAEECRNLLVPVCLSASHVAYGSLRMEPVYMMTGDAAGRAAAMAAEAGLSVQEINVSELRSYLDL